MSSGEWPDEFDQDLSRPKNEATGLDVFKASATFLSNELWREAGNSCTESSSGESGGDSSFGDAQLLLRSGIGAVLLAVNAFFAWVFSFALLKDIQSQNRRETSKRHYNRTCFETTPVKVWRAVNR